MLAEYLSKRSSAHALPTDTRRKIIRIVVFMPTRVCDQRIPKLFFNAGFISELIDRIFVAGFLGKRIYDDVGVFRRSNILKILELSCFYNFFLLHQLKSLRFNPIDYFCSQTMM